MSIITEEKKKEYNKRYYEKHRKKIRKQQNDYYRDNREDMLVKQKARSKKYYDSNKEKILERVRFRIANNVDGARDRKLQLARDRWKRDRDAMFVALGGAQCACWFNDVRALEIDHINGNGKEHRRNMSNSTYRDYVISHVDEFQVLCSNCHSIKTYEELGYGYKTTESNKNRR